MSKYIHRWITYPIHIFKGEGGGACEVLPLQKRGGGGGKSFSHAEGGEGGHKKFGGSFYLVA